MSNRKQTITLGIALVVTFLAILSRLWLAIPLLVIAVLLFWWGIEPKRTEEFIGRWPYGGYVLRGLAKLDETISRWS